MGLRNAARGLGAALVFLGQQGMERQREEERDQRLMDRSAALARLNQTIANENADIDAKRDLWTNEVRDDQLLGRRKGELAIQEPFEERESARTTQREIARETRENREWTRRNQVEFDRWRRQHSITEDTERSRELWRHEQGLDPASRARRYLRDGNSGNYVAVDADGNQTDTGIAFPTSEEDDLLGLDGDEAPAPARRGGSPPAPNTRRTLSARPPARQPDGERPPVPGARKGPDGNWYVTRGGRHFRVEQ